MFYQDLKLIYTSKKSFNECGCFYHLRKNLKIFFVFSSKQFNIYCNNNLHNVLKRIY